MVDNSIPMEYNYIQFVLGRTSVYMYGGNVENDGDGLGEGENGPQIQCHDVEMHLRQWRRNTYKGGMEYKC